MGDDGGYGDSSGGNGGGNWGSNNNYADNYNNYSYGNDTNDFSNKYSSYNDSKEDKYSAYSDSKNEESRVYSMVKQYESSKPNDEVTPKYDDTRANFAESPRSEQISTSTPTQENNTSNPTSDVPASSPVVSSESHSYSSKTEKPQESKKEEKDNEFGDDDDDDDDELKFKRDQPNITVTTAEINTPPGTCDHKTLAVLLGSVTTGHMSAESAHEAAELEALESLHDACKCNGDSRTAADDINLDDTRENMDLLNDSSETQPLEDGKKPEGDEDDCLLSVLSFCVTCCECVIS
uniref:Uncharacterized protein n=1 Tax=Cacopsylla melanoneura TaxID=428564 RepID=A0A8D8SNZ9_9HEMI